MSKIAAGNLISYLRINYISIKKKEILTQISEDFFNSDNYRYRMIYLDFYDHMSKTFSSKFLKENKLLHYCMGLSGDRIVNIRRKFVKIAPSLKKTILFDDNENLKRFEDIMSKLVLDFDKEVSEV